ncbi:MAG: DUF4019 domain-containing protein [Desulfobacterales bacterium]|nr:DUF4019 domain-containing protein [Desulfobacterales bacterium]
MKKIFVIGITALMLCCFGSLATAHESGTPHTHARHQDGLDTADLWLNLIDRGAYTTSWQTAAAVVKTQVTVDQWEGTLKAVREPMGKLEERQLFHHKFSTTMPGMPDGRYLLIRYKSRFAEKAAAIETVTLIQGPEDDTWRAAGYFIK